jgi:hypothetical protein
MMVRLKRIALLVGLLAIVIVGLVADRFVNGPTRTTGSPSTSPVGASPTAPAIPSPTLTGGTPLRPCAAQDLALAAFGWGGATGSMAGGATLINVSPEPCGLAGKPAVALFAKSGTEIAAGGPAEPGPAGDAVELSEGDVARVITVWSNWCGDSPTRPLTLRLSLPDGGGDLDAQVREDGNSSSLPRCDVQGAPSTIGVPTPFASLGPYEPNVEPAACRAGALAGYLGPWGAGLSNYFASVFILNSGGIDCLLPISPALELRDADGHLLVNGEQWDPDATIVLPSGWVAVARIDFASWCLAEPKLPFEFDVSIDSARLRLLPATERSVIGPPSCMVPGQTPQPVLTYESPFAVPGLSEP